MFYFNTIFDGKFIFGFFVLKIFSVKKCVKILVLKMRSRKIIDEARTVRLKTASMTSGRPGIQLWTVPRTGVYEITANGAGYRNNTGANITGKIRLLQKEIIAVAIGQMGENDDDPDQGMIFDQNFDF